MVCWRPARTGGTLVVLATVNGSSRSCDDEQGEIAVVGASGPAGPFDLHGEPEPPPNPVESAPRAADAVDAGPASPPPRRSRPIGRAVVAVTALAAAFVAGVFATEQGLGRATGGGSTVADDDATAIVLLLEDVVRTEGVMLTFNDVVGEGLEGARAEEEALAIVARAAAAGAGGLEALRPIIVERDGGAPVEGVRTAYLPHLDAWVDYLAALAIDPTLLFDRDGQQPFILLINATADEFRISLETLLAEGTSDRAAALAERILDDGFRTDGPEPTV